MTRRMRDLRTLWAGALLLLIGACASKPIYYWGNYERVLYKSMVANLSPTEQIKLMNEDVSGASKAGLPLPPGFHAQLGFLHSETGSTQLALAEFQAEKKEFPESATLMDRFLGYKAAAPAAKKAKGSK
jgi:hypothetical protein